MYAVALVIMSTVPSACPSPTMLPISSWHDRRVNEVLFRWIDWMAGVESLLAVELRRTDKDKCGLKTWEGEFRFLAPNRFALRLIQQEDVSRYELMISDGERLHLYHPLFRRVSVNPVSKTGWSFLDLWGEFLVPSPALTKTFPVMWAIVPRPFAVAAAVAALRQSYDVRVSKDVSASNPHYVYLDFKPAGPQVFFVVPRGQLVLTTDCRPRRWWVEHPNGNQVTWDFPNLDTTVRLKPGDFAAPPAPPHWEVIEYDLSTMIPVQDPVAGAPGQSLTAALVAGFEHLLRSIIEYASQRSPSK